MILPVEDLLGLEEQPNLPNTVDEHPNWRRRLPAALLEGTDAKRRLLIAMETRK
jgi:4-alpha-glucanotransferase